MKMFGFSRRRIKLGRLKSHLSDSTPGTRSPIRHVKRSNDSSGENVAHANAHTDDANCHSSSSEADANGSTSGNSENWMILSISGEKPSPRFNHAAAVVGSKMVVVGGETGHGLLEDVQVLNFDKLTWSPASPNYYLSPSSLPLKIPACKGHCLVSWGQKVLLIGGKTDPPSEKISVWAFSIENECWSYVEAKGDIPVARSSHTVMRAGSLLILFGGEDVKGRKLNDIHVFDLKSLMWLPLDCTGTGPSPRTNHVAALYDDRVLLIFGGASKSRTLNDLYSLDLQTMAWSRIKTRGFHPTPRAGCCGVLCGSKWYITGGGSRKRRHAETVVFDVLKVEWTTSLVSSSSSIITNKGFTLVQLVHKDRAYLIAFGGTKREPSSQVEVLLMTKNDDLQPVPDKDPLFSKKSSTSARAFLSHLTDGASAFSINSSARNNLSDGVEHHGSGRRSLSGFSIDPSSNISHHKKSANEEGLSVQRMRNILEDDSIRETTDSLATNTATSKSMEPRSRPLDAGVQTDFDGTLQNDASFAFESESTKTLQKQLYGNLLYDDDVVHLEPDQSKSIKMPGNVYQLYEAKIEALLKKNSLLEDQLATALANQEMAEKDLSSSFRNRQEVEKRLGETLKETEILKEKLAAVEVAQEEANTLSNIVHSDNVRLEHDVAFLKAVLDDTQKELHSTRGVLAGERARAFQLQVEVFHLKQRLQAVDNRASTPRKPFHT